MTYAAVPIPDGTWGVDLSSKCTAAILDALATLDLGIPGSTSPRVITRYVGLGGPAAGDIDPAELQLLLEHPANYWLVLVQHVEAGLWTADGITGTQHGEHAAADAIWAGYDPTIYGPLSLCVDMESIKAGTRALDYVHCWLNSISTAKFGEYVYEGFDAGLSGVELLGLSCPLWSDFGPRALPWGATFTCKQHPEQRVLGTPIDPDRYAVDSRGQQVVGLRRVADLVENDPEPHQDPEATIPA